MVWAQISTYRLAIRKMGKLLRRALFKQKIQTMLSPWRDGVSKGTILANNLESSYKSIGPLDSKFRVQIIDGIVYGVPPECCLALQNIRIAARQN